jgi:hypothetical protein
MAILHLDGFDTYTNTTDVAARYPGTTAGNIGFSTTAGRFGGGMVASSSGTSLAQLASVIIPHSGSGAIVAGGATWFAASNTTFPVLTFGNSTGNAAASGSELSLNYHNDLGGILQLRRGGYQSGGGTLIASSTVGFPNGLWHHVEMKATVADSGGAVEVRVNGTTVISYSGDTRASTTGTAGIDRVNFATYSTSTTTGGGWDDIYILDTSGSVANDFLGDVRINTLAPTSDSAVQFTRSTGASNYLCVDEGRQNSDTDYVESSTVGHIDKYGYADLSASVATVYGLQALTWAKKTDATTRTMRNKLYSGATTTDGTAYALTTSYLPYAQVATLNPDGSVQWTPTTVNAALAGFEVVS